jgi:hypothetical protein
MKDGQTLVVLRLTGLYMESVTQVTISPHDYAKIISKSSHVLFLFLLDKDTRFINSFPASAAVYALTHLILGTE